MILHQWSCLDRRCYGLRGRTKRHFVFLIRIARADEHIDLMNSGNPFVTLSDNERLRAFVDVLSALYEKSPGYKSEKVMKRAEFNGAMGESVIC